MSWVSLADRTAFDALDYLTDYLTAINSIETTSFTVLKGLLWRSHAFCVESKVYGFSVDNGELENHFRFNPLIVDEIHLA